MLLDVHEDRTDYEGRGSPGRPPRLLLTHLLSSENEKTDFTSDFNWRQGPVSVSSTWSKPTRQAYLSNPDVIVNLLTEDSRAITSLPPSPHPPAQTPTQPTHPLTPAAFFFFPTPTSQGYSASPASMQVTSYCSPSWFFPASTSLFSTHTGRCLTSVCA